MGVRLIFLGTGGWISIPNRAFPSIVLDVGDVYYMIDAGEACSRQFMKTELNPYKLKVIFITHHHGDHTLGLPGLAINLYKMGVTEKETIKVYAPYWCEKHIKGLFNYGGLKESVILGFHFFKETLGKNKVYSDKNDLNNPFHHAPQDIP